MIKKYLETKEKFIVLDKNGGLHCLTDNLKSAMTVAKISNEDLEIYKATPYMKKMKDGAIVLTKM